MHLLVTAILLSAVAEPRVAVREALVRGELSAAIDVAQPWVASSPDALGCYAALLEADGRMKEAAKVKSRLPKAPPAPPPVPTQAPKLPAQAYVSASSLTLRSAASPTAGVVAMLPIGTKVQVMGQGGPFVKVRAERGIRPMRVFTLDAGDKGFEVPEAEAGPLVGYAAAAFLSGERPEVAALKKQAESADLGTRATALERLAGLERDLETYAQLAGAAFDAGRCGVAAHAATQLGRLKGERGGYALDVLELFYRCRGALAHAVRVLPTDKQLKAKKVPANACVVGVDPQPDCGFCPLEFDNPEGPAARKAEAAHAKKAAAFEARIRAMEELFPDGPLLHVVVRQVADDAEPLVVVSTQRFPEPCGEGPQPPGVEATALVLPKMNPDEAVDLWLRVGAFESWRYRVMSASAFDRVNAPYQAALADWLQHPAKELPSLQLEEGWETSGPKPVSCCCD